MFSSLPFSFLPLSRFVCRDKQCEMSQDAKKKSCSNRTKKKKEKGGPSVGTSAKMLDSRFGVGF